MYRFLHWESVFSGEDWPDKILSLDSTERKAILSVLSFISYSDVWLKDYAPYKLADSEQAVIDGLLAKLEE